MMMMMLIILFSFLGTTIFGAATPQVCTELQVSHLTVYPNGNVSVSATLTLFQEDNSTTIQVSNIAAENHMHFGPPQSVCLNDNDIDNPYEENCTSIAAAPFNFTLINPYFYLDVQFRSAPQSLYVGYGDEGTFSQPDGSLFSLENPSFSTIENDTILDISTQTCTTFVAVSQAPPAPKCKTFRSRTTVYNPSDNFSIYATSFLNYSFAGGAMTTNGSYSGPAGFYLSYTINNDYDCDSRVTLSCNFPIPTADAKIFITADLYKHVGFDILSYPLPNPGKFLIRGNETLIDEGEPFTPQNDCIYSSAPYDTDYMASNNFCCIEFES